jgi:PEP-CTERM motif-containing protein
MLKIKTLVLGGVLWLVAAACYADSVTTIPITGTTYDGFATTQGDYRIQGPGLSLWEGTLGGPSFIGECTIGTVCNFSWSPVGPYAYCTLCSRFTGGSFGSTQVQWLEPALLFKGSAFYSGGDTLTMNFTVIGTIYGFQLVNCDAYGYCSLGPQVFALKISGSGTETLTINELSGTPSEIIGLSGTFSGTATPITTTPEPGSMILMGTGLAGVWIKRRRRV